VVGVRHDLMRAADQPLHAVLQVIKAHGAVTRKAAGRKREMNANAKRIAEGDWASDAVRHAIDSMNAAVIAATSSTAVFGGGT